MPLGVFTHTTTSAGQCFCASVSMLNDCTLPSSANATIGAEARSASTRKAFNPLIAFSPVSSTPTRRLGRLEESMVVPLAKDQPKLGANTESTASCSGSTEPRGKELSAACRSKVLWVFDYEVSPHRAF